MITDYLFNDISQNFKYKLEKKDRIKYPRMAGYSRQDIFKFVEQSWNIRNDVQDNDFSSLVEQILESNKGCFLQGRAGTGKSHLI